MSPGYPKKWFIVPHEEFPAESLPLGQLLGGIDKISHPLNRTMRKHPTPGDVTRTMQTNFNMSLSYKKNMRAEVDAEAPLPSATGEAGAGAGAGVDDNISNNADAVFTEILRPSDEYAGQSFAAARDETEMANHLRHKRWWKRKVFMVTGRKVGWAITINRNDSKSFDEHVKAALDLRGPAKLGAVLSGDWKSKLRITSLTAMPCVFAIQLKRVKYHGTSNNVKTEDYDKNAVFERENQEPEEDSEEEDEGDSNKVFVADGVLEEAPWVDQFDYDSVLLTGPDGEEETFMVPVGDT